MVTIRKALCAATALSFLLAMPVGASAETIFGAMAKAYANNPDLNAARAGLRATDEGVTIAKSGYRPKVSATATLSSIRTDGNTSLTSRSGTVNSGQAGIVVTQTLFDGFQTLNNVRAAESSVFSSREQLRGTEIDILQAAAQAYANVARDRQIVSIRKQNLKFLREQLNAAQARLDVGEGTRTDVSQAQAQLAAAQALLESAVAQVRSSEAVYVQIVGDQPTGIKLPAPQTRLLPGSLDQALAIGRTENPTITAALYDVDSSDYQVKAAEGALLPGVNLQGEVTTDTDGVTQSSIAAQLSVPLYQGGAASGRVRQAKELLGQSRILVDSARRAVEQNLVTTWTQFAAARANITANQSQLRAANLALEGVIEERNVGQRTTLDVLDAQQTVLNAQEALVGSQRDAVVASYLVLAYMGRLTISRLGLQVAEYRPDDHYQAVKDKWYGLRTPDGR